MVCNSVENDEIDLKPKYIIIRDLTSNDQQSVQILEEQLENAYESCTQHIIIEPVSVGNLVTKWITVGNFLHKTSVISGAVCMLTPLFCPKKYRYYMTMPLCSMNLFCMTLYNFSWRKDPCCKYQVEGNMERLGQLNLQTLAHSSPIVLVYRDDKYRKRLHNFFSFCCAGYLVVQVYKYYKG